MDEDPTDLAIGLAIASYGTERGCKTQAAEAKTSPEIYQTLYLTNLTQPNDADELVNDLRNMLSKAKLMYVPSQSAISFRGSAEDLALAQKILSDLDKTKKIYRLTYTMKESDGGKTIGLQHFSIIVASGSRTASNKAAGFRYLPRNCLPRARTLSLPTSM